jgi:phenylacetate-CoA ligase
MRQILDQLRSQYLRLPLAIKMAIAPVLKTLPVSLRYGSTYRQTRENIVRSETDADFVQGYQRTALQKLLARTLRRSPFISARFGRLLGAELDPFTFELDQLGLLPILMKKEVVDAPEAFCVSESEGHDVGYTSGSSGQPPMRLYLDRDRGVREMAFQHHIWSRIGYRAGDGRAVLRDYGGNIATADNTWRYDSALRELWLSPFHLTSAVMDQYLQLFHKHEVRYLYGVPSAIDILARHALSAEWRPPASFRGVIAASETLFSHQRLLISRCFNTPVIAFYGLSERVAIAGELVDDPGTYEFEPLYGIAELVNDSGKRITTPGQRGRLISTGFINRAMALVRYDTGDRATLVQDAVHSNRYRLRVRDIASRWNQEFVVGRGGEKISVVNLDPNDYVGVITEYQYVQLAPGRAIFRAVPCMGATKNDLEAVLADLQRPVRGVIEFQLEIVDAIPVGKTGKRKIVDQRISSSHQQ